MAGSPAAPEPIGAQHLPLLSDDHGAVCTSLIGVLMLPGMSPGFIFFEVEFVFALEGRCHLRLLHPLLCTALSGPHGTCRLLGALVIMLVDMDEEVLVELHEWLVWAAVSKGNLNFHLCGVLCGSVVTGD